MPFRVTRLRQFRILALEIIYQFENDCYMYICA